VRRAGFRLAVKKVLRYQGKLNGCLYFPAQREMLMDKKIVGLVGAISGLMSLSTAQATTVPPTETALPSAQSFGELLDPIPNAAALLRIADEAGHHNQTGTNPNVKLAYDHHHHHKYHHHHHHHNYHHHHHHHNYHHHHHHHHHQPKY
jgi:hypothetical protein